MGEASIKEIVTEVFQRAAAKSVVHTKSALAGQIAEEITEAHGYIHPRTLERAYDRYVNGKATYGIPQAESVALLCKYLGYGSYAEYAAKKQVGKEKRSFHWPPWATKALWVGGMCILLLFIVRRMGFSEAKKGSGEGRCMAWADSVYVEASCNKAPYSPFGTKIEPWDAVRMESLKKVRVTQAYPFFSEEGQPLVWYTKTKQNDIEFFTAPGLHPVSGETLRKITPYIIQKYVPLHIEREDSFVK